ncbi:MAG: hemerythrin domain-containing protein [Deltaproteobacteria bacterium]|nr:hemerythrin domain-containing protein [Deltaproteobacteria bacterium]
MDILHYLKTQHDSIRGIYRRVAEAKVPKERKSQLESLVRSTQVYLTLQRDFLYPELSGSFAAADGLISTSESNAKTIDKAMKSMINVASMAAFDASAFEDKMSSLGRALTAHFDQEEQNLLPKIRDFIRTEDREDLGLVFADAESELLAALDSGGGLSPARRRRA